MKKLLKKLERIKKAKKTATTREAQDRLYLEEAIVSKKILELKYLKEKFDK